MNKKLRQLGIVATGVAILGVFLIAGIAFAQGPAEEARTDVTFLARGGAYTFTVKSGHEVTLTDFQNPAPPMTATLRAMSPFSFTLTAPGEPPDQGIGKTESRTDPFTAEFPVAPGATIGVERADVQIRLEVAGAAHFVLADRPTTEPTPTPAVTPTVQVGRTLVRTTGPITLTKGVTHTVVLTPSEGERWGLAVPTGTVRVEMASDGAFGFGDSLATPGAGGSATLHAAFGPGSVDTAPIVTTRSGQKVTVTLVADTDVIATWVRDVPVAGETPKAKPGTMPGTSGVFGPNGGNPEEGPEVAGQDEPDFPPPWCAGGLLPLGAVVFASRRR